MTPRIDLNQRTYSSTTLPAHEAPLGRATERSERFSALMRQKQDAGRPGVTLPVGGQVRTTPALDGGALVASEKSTGPRGDPVSPPVELEELQHHGPELSQEQPASEALSPWVEPLQRVIAHSILPTESVAPPALQPSLALEQVWQAVRRIAWGGDRQRSVAYIELGAGELDGAALTLEARGSAISVVLELPQGVAAAGWAERLAARLEGRGLEVQSVQVR